MQNPMQGVVDQLNARPTVGDKIEATAEELEAEARGRFLAGDLRMHEFEKPPAVEVVATKMLRVANYPEMMAWRRLTQTERDNNIGRVRTVDSTAEEIVERLDAEAPDLDKVRAVHQVPFNTVVHTFEQALDSMLARCRQVMIDRQRKYGSKNITRSGQVGVMYQIENKYWRLDNLYFDADHNPLPLSAETPAEGMVKEDTFVDLANYAIIELMLRAGIWGLPMEENNGKSVQLPE